MRYNDLKNGIEQFIINDGISRYSSIEIKNYELYVSIKMNEEEMLMDSLLENGIGRRIFNFIERKYSGVTMEDFRFYATNINLQLENIDIIANINTNNMMRGEMEVV